jgi:hypothetical protein
MKSFREFIIEKSESDILRKDAEKLQRMARPETSSTSAEQIRRGLQPAQERQARKTRKAPSALTQGQIAGAWKSGSAGKPSVIATSNKPEGGTWFGSSKKAIEKGQEKIRQQVRDTIAKNRGGSAELQAAQSSGPRETMVGKGAKSGTGATYRANRPSETKATGVSNLPPKGQSRGRTGSKQFSGDARYREMLAKMDDAPAKKPRTRTVKQADVSKDIAQKTSDYKTERGERAYRKTSADIEARRAFPTGKGGLKADEANPYVKREVRQARADKLGGNVWDQPKGSSEPFKGQGKSPSKTTYPSFFKPTKPNVTASRISKTAAPDRSATKQAVGFLKNLRRKSSSTSTPKNATTHGVGPDGKYLSPEMRKAVHKNRNVSSVVVHQPPKEKKKTGGGMVRKPSADALQRAVAGGNKPRLSKSPTQSQQPQMTAKSVGKQVSKSISKTQARGRVGAGGVLSALGAAQEYKVGAARAKAEGKGKLGQLFRGAMRAGGAFLGGTGGTALGGAVTKSGIGAAAAGAYGYSKGAEAGSSLAKKVEKSKAGKWLASKAKQYVPGLK